MCARIISLEHVAIFDLGKMYFLFVFVLSSILFYSFGEAPSSASLSSMRLSTFFSLLRSGFRHMKQIDCKILSVLQIGFSNMYFVLCILCFVLRCLFFLLRPCISRCIFVQLFTNLVSSPGTTWKKHTQIKGGRIFCWSFSYAVRAFIDLCAPRNFDSFHLFTWHLGCFLMMAKHKILLYSLLRLTENKSSMYGNMKRKTKPIYTQFTNQKMVSFFHYGALRTTLVPLSDTS